MEHRICVRCGATFSIEHTSCPYCGYTFPAFAKPAKKPPHEFPYYIGICLSLGLAAGIIAGITEGIFMFPFYLPFIGTPSNLTYILIAAIIAPAAEEPAKILGLYIVHFSEDVSFKMRRWIILGVFGALGFALLENALYATVASMGYGWYGAGLTLLVRTMLSMPFHLIASAFAAFGFGLFVHTKKLKYFISFLALAMFIHGLFNLAASYI